MFNWPLAKYLLYIDKYKLFDLNVHKSTISSKLTFLIFYALDMTDSKDSVQHYPQFVAGQAAIIFPLSAPNALNFQLRLLHTFTDSFQIEIFLSAVIDNAICTESKVKLE